MGKDKVDGLLGKKEFLSGDADGIFGSGGIRRLTHSESLADTLRNTNPLHGKSEGRNNCSLCGIAAALRQRGYNVVAKSTGGAPQNLGGIIEECFKGAKVFDGSAVKFGRSRQDAAEMLLKRFGENAEGVCNIQWKGKNSGHVFNWQIKNGVVSFFDAQNGLDDASVSSSFWKLIDPQGFLQLARLDNVEIDFEAIKKYVE